MTKEELEKEAKKFLGGWLIDPEIVKLLVDFAEPREKKIKSLGERCLQLQKDKGELTDRVAELEAQIEKMKCCENCGWFYLQQHWRENKGINESRMFHCGTCGNKRNWKIREIREK